LREEKVSEKLKLSEPTTGETYQERVNRWRIMRHEELPEAHKAEYRLSGIDPDDLWSLIWSFETEQVAVEMLDKLNRRASKFWTYRLVDGGEATEIERSVSGTLAIISRVTFEVSSAINFSFSSCDPRGKN
jgi:hypothetical protein